ncbi:sporulation protein YabP [uncultured Bilophila sp.]|nr:sporulation protein YabP [uncultured Bilophila sp.]
MIPLHPHLQNHEYGSANQGQGKCFPLRGLGQPPKNRSVFFFVRISLEQRGRFFMAEEKKKGRHTLNMEERERVRIGGVMEVLSFDEDGIMMETTCGLLLLKGAGMHIGKLDLEAGDVVVDGSIDSMTYSDGTLAEKHSILGRLFR